MLDENNHLANGRQETNYQKKNLLMDSIPSPVTDVAMEVLRESIIYRMQQMRQGNPNFCTSANGVAADFNFEHTPSFGNNIEGSVDLLQ